jgi:hypothetical protein
MAKVATFRILFVGALRLIAAVPIRSVPVLSCQES